MHSISTSSTTLPKISFRVKIKLKDVTWWYLNISRDVSPFFFNDWEAPNVIKETPMSLKTAQTVPVCLNGFWLPHPIEDQWRRCPGMVMGLGADTAFLSALLLSQMPNPSDVGELILKPLAHQEKRLHLSYQRPWKVHWEPNMILAYLRWLSGAINV